MVDFKSRDYLRRIRQEVTQHFSLVELQSLAHELGVGWDDLEGDLASEKSHALTLHLARRGRLAELLSLLRNEKPGVAWPKIPPREEQIADAHTSSADEIFDETFHQYLAAMSELLRGENLWSAGGEVRSAFQTGTLSALSSLDGESKGQLIRFLHDTKMIGEAAIVNPDGAELDRAKLSGADLNGVNLSGANLRHADLSKAKLRRADLSRATLGGADFWGADLYQANLQGAHLWGANLNKTNLRQANLTGARLSDADLWGANLSEANMDGAYLWQTNLKDAILVGVKNFTPEQLEAASSIEGTILHSGK